MWYFVFDQGEGLSVVFEVRYKDPNEVSVIYAVRLYFKDAIDAFESYAPKYVLVGICPTG